MDFTSQHNDFVNPADLYTYDSFAPLDSTIKSELDYLDTNLAPTTADEYSGNQQLAGSHQDSAVDLRGYYATGYPRVKQEFSNDFDTDYPRVKTEFSSNDLDTFLNTQYSTPASNASNTPSPHGDMIFSNANSPGDYTRDQSQTSSPEANEMLAKDNWDYKTSTDDVILIPQTVDPLKVSIFVDKNKTRAETQIKTTVVLDPLPRQYQYIRFPRHTLSKSKQLANDDEVSQNEEGNSSVRLALTLVCATAVEKQDGLDRALKRARGEEKTPSRPKGTQVSEIDKDDPAHPQNGGAVVICEGCKERERKRYDRKKKRNQEEENEWSNYEDQRIIMINEKEFKRWQDVEPGQHSLDAKKVEFAMRITCYCRHQEEKSPVGYKVIFTFRDINDVVVAQKVSEIIQITDDHKNREMPVVESLTTDLTIHPPRPTQNDMTSQYAMPMYNYTSPPVYGLYSQPTTPVLPQNFTPLSPIEPQYSQNAGGSVAPQAPHQFGFNNGPVATPTPAASFASHQRYQSYSNTPMLSPTEQFSQQQVGYPLHRPHSLDSFSAAFACMYPQQNPYSQPFASQPPSRNVSRPASPSWESGPSRGTKKMRAVPGFFMVEDPDNE